MKVLFINDSTSNPNWGDRAAAVSLRRMIEEVGGEVTHSISEYGLSSSTFDGPSAAVQAEDGRTARETLKLFLPPILMKVRRRIMPDPYLTRANRMIPAKWNDFARCARAVFNDRGNWPAVLEAIAAVDMVVIHGDGAMVNNGVIPRTDLFLSYLIKTHFPRPTVIVNHTADFNHPDLREMAEHVYPLFDDVVFRDPVSAERCKYFCAGRFAGDTAFWFKPIERDELAKVGRRLTYFDVWPDTAAFDPSIPYICIGGSSSSGFERRPFPIRQAYIALIERLRSVYKGQVVLTASDVTDEAMFRPVAERLGLPVLGVRIPVQQAVDVVGNADAYIGGRWHPSIFALSGGTPIIPFSSKTFKMAALARMAGFSSDLFDVSNLTSEAPAVCDRLLWCLERGEELRRDLSRWSRAMCENSWDNVAQVRKCGNRGESSFGDKRSGVSARG